MTEREAGKVTPGTESKERGVEDGHQGVAAGHGALQGEHWSGAILSPGSKTWSSSRYSQGSVNPQVHRSGRPTSPGGKRNDQGKNYDLKVRV